MKRLPKLKKKVIVLIVEGTTDETILGYFFEQLIQNNKFVIKVIAGDVFTDSRNRMLSPKAILGQQIAKIKAVNKFTDTDFICIAQLIDTDGMFIPPTDFIVNNTLNSGEKTYFYDLTTRQVKVNSEKNRAKLLHLWQLKKNKVLPLTTAITYGPLALPVYIFFNSLNLEHVTQDLIAPADQKMELSLRFIDKMQDDLANFLKFLTEKKIGDSYLDSWTRLGHDQDWSQSKSNLIYFAELISKLDH